MAGAAGGRAAHPAAQEGGGHRGQESPHQHWPSAPAPPDQECQESAGIPADHGCCQEAHLPAVLQRGPGHPDIHREGPEIRDVRQHDLPGRSQELH